MITQEDAIQLFRYNNKYIDELSNEDRLQIADWIEKLQKYEQPEATAKERINMSRTTDLEIRMKTYENVPKNKLMRRCPVAIRLDGCHFKSFTKSFDKPFDKVFMKSMQETMKYLCENVQGCVMGYTQSDEITLILVDYEHLNSEAWFDDEVEKICSVTAGMASMVFNRIFYENADEFISEN